MTERAGIGEDFVTAACFTYLPGESCLRWAYAGHPPALWLDDGEQLIAAKQGVPLGIDADLECVEGTRHCEPGQGVLLYTDGLTEARGPDGTMLAVDGLSEFIEREAGAGQTTPETLRRLRRAILGSERAQLRDDATALLVEWRRGAELDLMPHTVL
jgi:serine phosphatase RsbU (regulator of sigma subunit)